ncbi:MAG: hypothetical protein IJQ81_13850 [Oscillibacter sp.]|nr:hypothetical protein [Oscillibacter sp.]
MLASVFLSCQTPYLQSQQEFIDKLEADLKSRDLFPRTVGKTDFSSKTPLSTVRSLMLDSNGLIAIAFRRHYVEKGIEKPDSDMKKEPKDISKRWFTTPWCQIEPAMAFQIGLPVLIFREKGVLDEGILEKGVFGTYMPEFDLDSIEPYFQSKEYRQVIQDWEHKVWQVVGRKGTPPKLYDE